MAMKKKVLLVQEPSLHFERQLALMKELDVEVLMASTAEYALELHRSQKASVIVADLDLPLMGGDALCEAIRKDSTLHRAYIMLICHGRKAELARCGKCGADSYLKLPFEPLELQERVSRLMEGSSRRSVRVLLKITVKSQYKSETFFCTSRNISSSGILIDTDRVLAKGDMLYCSFFLPDTARVEAQGKVVRIGKGMENLYECGVEFDNIEPAHLEILDKYIQRERHQGNIA